MSDSGLYTRLLLPKRHGYPLSCPTPYGDAPLEARQAGTEIGDVGVVMSDGSFDVIFNICRAPDDHINRFGVPRGFEQVHFGPEDVALLPEFHDPGCHVSNTTINKRRLGVDAGAESNVFLPLGAGAVVEISTSSKEAAILLLPDGASRANLRPVKKFRNYAIKHAQRWYEFVNGNLERMVENGDLYLVTGMDKTSSWSIAAAENQSEDCRISLKLKAAQVGAAQASYIWEWEAASSFAASGPRRPPAEELWGQNQTVFLRGYKVAIRSMPLKRSAKALSIVDSKPSDILSKSGFVPFSESPSGSSSFFRGASTSGQGSASDDVGSSPSSDSCGASDSSGASDSGGTSDKEELVEYFPQSTKSYHPGCAINEYLLSSTADAMVAVTHDEEWMSLLNEDDEEIPQDCELVRRISYKYNIEGTADGVWLTMLNEGASNPEARPQLTDLIPTASSVILDEAPDKFFDGGEVRELEYQYSTISPHPMRNFERLGCTDTDDETKDADSALLRSPENVSTELSPGPAGIDQLQSHVVTDLNNSLWQDSRVMQTVEPPSSELPLEYNMRLFAPSNEFLAPISASIPPPLPIGSSFVHSNDYALVNGNKTDDIEKLQQELERTREEKETLAAQYRNLLAKMTSMGNKLEQDTEELDRREVLVQQLQAQNDEPTSTMEMPKEELVSTSAEAQRASGELDNMRSEALKESVQESLVRERELRETQTELEQCRTEKYEWERTALQERVLAAEARSNAELYRRALELEWETRKRDAPELESEWEISDRLQFVLQDFETWKDHKRQQAANPQLARVTQLLTAELRLKKPQTNTSQMQELEKEVKQTLLDEKLRHEAIIMNEHLTMALHRLQNHLTEPDPGNIDCRLVTNTLLSFLTTPHTDPKRFEMLSLLASFLSWSDREREKAGLQRRSDREREKAGLQRMPSRTPSRPLSRNPIVSTSPFRNKFPQEDSLLASRKGKEKKVDDEFLPSLPPTYSYISQ